MKAATTGITGAHVLWAMIGFFAVIIGLNVVFITYAVRSHPGEQVKNSYVLGLDYNRQLARQDAQRGLGWTLNAGLADAGDTFVVHLVDSAGTPLSGLDVSVRIHVAGVRQDGERVALRETAPGEYTAAMQLEGPGRIEAQIAVSRGKDDPAVFEAQKILVLS